MEIYSLSIPDIKIIKPKKFGDHRGYFSETFNEKSLLDLGINLKFIQDNQSLSVEKKYFKRPAFSESTFCSR